MSTSLTLLAAWAIASPNASPVQRSTPVVVPAQMLGFYFVVEGKVNGKPARLIVDTGAGACVMTPEAAKRIKLPEGHAISANGVGEKAVPARLTTAESISLGNATAKNLMVAIIELPAALQCDGLIGYSFLKDFAVSLDYQAPNLTFYAPKTFKPPIGSTTVEMRVQGNIPNIPGSLASIEGWYSVDSGAAGTLTVMTPFAESNKLKDKYPNRVERVVGKGVGGFVRGESLRLHGVKFGGVEFPPIPASISATKSGAFANPALIGNLGGELLRRFRTTLDYPSGKATFERSPAFGEEYREDRSGIFVDFAESGATVVDVVKGGPADRAGVKVGDKILEVDDILISRIHPLEASKYFRQDNGKKVKLRLQRGSEVLQLEILLRTLV